jgi:hypothetical protein
MASGINKYSAQVAATLATVSVVPVRVISLALLNTTAAVAYLQMFFRESGVTLGVTAPDMVIPLPANGGLALTIPDGWWLGGTGLIIAGTSTRTGATGAAIDVALVMG